MHRYPARVCLASRPARLRHRLTPFFQICLLNHFQPEALLPSPLSHPPTATHSCLYPKSEMTCATLVLQVRVTVSGLKRFTTQLTVALPSSPSRFNIRSGNCKCFWINENISRFIQSCRKWTPRWNTALPD